MNHADGNRKGELARNVAVALRFKKSQGTPAMPQVELEVLASNYDRARGGIFAPSCFSNSVSSIMNQPSTICPSTMRSHATS